MGAALPERSDCPVAIRSPRSTQRRARGALRHPSQLLAKGPGRRSATIRTTGESGTRIARGGWRDIRPTSLSRKRGGDSEPDVVLRQASAGRGLESRVRLGTDERRAARVQPVRPALRTRELAWRRISRESTSISSCGHHGLSLLVRRSYSRWLGRRRNCGRAVTRDLEQSHRHAAHRT